MAKPVEPLMSESILSRAEGVPALPAASAAVPVAVLDADSGGCSCGGGCRCGCQSGGGCSCGGAGYC